MSAPSSWRQKACHNFVSKEGNLGLNSIYDYFSYNLNHKHDLKFSSSSLRIEDRHDIK